MKMPRSQKRIRFLAAVCLLLFYDNSIRRYSVVEAFGNSRNCKSQTLRIQGERRRTRIRSPLYSSRDDIGSNNGASGSSEAGYWSLPNDFSMFLTQRSIQSFMFLTSQLRDPETCYWVEDFTRPNLVPRGGSDASFSLSDAIPNLDEMAKRDWTPNDIADSSKKDEPQEEESEADKRTCHLLRYHGLAAMDTSRFPTWEHYFEHLLEQPTDSWIIASDLKHIPDYTWEIDPSSLCSRILSVREQLSREFVKDLQAVSDMGGQTFDWYWEKLRQSRETEQQEKNQQEGQQPPSNSHESHSFDPSFSPLTSLRGSRENLLFLEINVDDPTLDHKPSPLRRGNFDLLVLLATEEAIHRVLNQWEAQRSEGDLRGAEYVSHEFLETFYQERQHFFHGPLPSYGKADDLLEELLDSALMFKEARGDGNDGSASVINPTKIAELVLRERERVALDWMAIAKEAPVHHMKIQKLRLTKMMMGNDNGGVAEVAGAHSCTGESGSFDPGPGAFE